MFFAKKFNSFATVIISFAKGVIFFAKDLIFFAKDIRSFAKGLNIFAKKIIPDPKENSALLTRAFSFLVEILVLAETQRKKIGKDRWFMWNCTLVLTTGVQTV